MSNASENRPLGDVIGGLMTDISTLVRKEIQLAKAETSEKIGQAVTGLEMVVAGAVLALGALGVLLAAAVSALAAIFVSNGMDPTAANSLSALIIGAIVGILAVILIVMGLNHLKPKELQLDRTARSIARDAELVKETL